ncbi:MAG: ABC transporter ATP-binding protein [Alistipes sp.]|nr:ABC transporter ATP-binding protein [Alistipes sp.]
MLKKVLAIIPSQFYGRGVLVAITILLRALLNFIGITLFIPLLMLILDNKSMHQNEKIQALYDILGCNSDTQFTIIIAAGIVAAIAIKNIIALWLFRFERDFTYSLYSNLSRRLYIDYYRRGLAFARQHNSAELSRNVNFVCLNFVTGILKPIAMLCSEAILFALIIIALAILSIKAALLLIVIFLPTVWLYYFFIRRKLNKYGKAENEAHKSRFKSVTESFKGYADIEISNAFTQMLSAFNDSTDKLIAMRKHNATLSALPQSITETTLATGMATIVIIGAYIQGNIGLIFGIFAVAAVRLMPSVRNILSAVTAIRYNLYTLDTLQNIEDNAIANEQTSERLRLREKIEINNLSFEYDGQQSKEGASVIDNLSLTILRGERIGIKGASGAGKSTLMNLILGLYTPTSGEILIDGIKLDSTTRRKWQNSIGYVPQNVFIADSTLAENIALGIAPQNIDRQRVEEVLEMASLKQFTEGLAEGLDTMIGESGCRVSGGERQRIGIARALYSQPDILFFDEATSALDKETEQSVNKSIETLSVNNRNLTIVVIAHRETSLGYCDRIINIGE